MRTKGHCIVRSQPCEETLPEDASGLNSKAPPDPGRVEKEGCDIDAVGLAVDRLLAAAGEIEHQLGAAIRGGIQRRTGTTCIPTGASAISASLMC